MKMVKVKIKGHILPLKKGDPWVPVERWGIRPFDNTCRPNIICTDCRSVSFPECLSICTFPDMKVTQEEIDYYYSALNSPCVDSEDKIFFDVADDSEWLQKYISEPMSGYMMIEDDESDLLYNVY